MFLVGRKIMITSSFDVFPRLIISNVEYQRKHFLWPLYWNFVVLLWNLLLSIMDFHFSLIDFVCTVLYQLSNYGLQKLLLISNHCLFLSLYHKLILCSPTSLECNQYDSIAAWYKHLGIKRTLFLWMYRCT